MSAKILLPALLALLQLATTLPGPAAEALPITSKPIGDTAENLAWQAWIMLPPQQQNLEKSRKVTPKSIFILPNRVQIPAQGALPSVDGEGDVGSGQYAPLECPPGQRQFEARCIPTLDIDREQLLIEELQILLQHGPGGGGDGNNYEYDYDYDEEAAPGPLTPDGEEESLLLLPELTVGAGGGNFDDAARLPSEDAPLKFNIFRHKFPTGDGAAAAQGASETPLLPLHEQQQNASDRWTEGSRFASNAVTRIEASSPSPSPSSTTPDFSLSDIDAIVLPASPQRQQQQGFAVFKDDSAMQLVSAASDRVNDRLHHNQQQQQRQEQQQRQQDITELLKADSLMPLLSVAPESATPPSTPLTPTSAQTFIDQVGETTTFAADLAELLAEAEAHTSQERDKEERPRSVTEAEPESSTQLDLIEDEVTTTTADDEAETTLRAADADRDPEAAELPTTASSFQLDETTVIEAHDAPMVERQEIAATRTEADTEKAMEKETEKETETGTETGTERVREAGVQHPREPESRNRHAAQQKSKVKPVAAGSAGLRATPLPSAGQRRIAGGDRFYYQHLDGAASTTATTRRTTTATETTSSEIDIEQELRLINELVKGRQRAGATTTTTPSSASTASSEAATTTSDDQPATTEFLLSPTAAAPASSTANPVGTDRVVAATTSTTSSSAPSSPGKETATTITGTTTMATSASATAAAMEEMTRVASTGGEAVTVVDMSESPATTSTTTTTIMTRAPTTTAPNPTSTTSRTPTTAEAPSTIWSKIMPILGLGSAATTTTATTTTTTPSPLPTTTISSDFNRSHRNSKIIRIESLQANSLRDPRKPTATGTTTSTTERTTTTTAPGDAFWWLPIGWRLDRPAPSDIEVDAEAATIGGEEAEAEAEAPSLLMRFWSAFPGHQQTKEQARSQ